MLPPPPPLVPLRPRRLRFVPTGSLELLKFFLSTVGALVGFPYLLLALRRFAADLVIFMLIRSFLLVMVVDINLFETLMFDVLTYSLGTSFCLVQYDIPNISATVVDPYFFALTGKVSNEGIKVAVIIHIA